MNFIFLMQPLFFFLVIKTNSDELRNLNSNKEKIG